MRVPDAEYQWRESDIYSVNVDTGAITQLTRRKGPDNNPQVSPDGKLVAYTGLDQSRNTWTDTKLWIMNIDGSNPRLVSGEWDRSPQNVQWKADGTGLYFTAQDAGSQNLYVLPMAGTRTDVVQPVTKGSYMLTTTSVSKTGKAVGVLTSIHQPPDIVTYDVAKPDQIKQLTAVNDDILKGKKLGDVKEMWYTSPDGLKIQGWYITPPGFDATKKYPMQLHIHGGPHSMYGVGFNYGWQEQAANGYVILYTNPRGSTGYGSEFGNRINNAYPSKDYDDLMAGVDELLKKGFVDERNMFVTGCSGGGVLTAWIVGKTDRFAAASANCPVIDWVSFVGTTDGAGWYNNFAKAAVGRSQRTLPPLAAELRRQRQDADDVDDGRQRSAHADAADRAVLQRAETAQGADGDDSLQRRMARHDVEALELHPHAAVSAVLVRQAQTRHGRDDDRGAAAVRLI